MPDLVFLAQVAGKLRDADERRKNQQRLLDDEIEKAVAGGATWTELIKATGYGKRSLQLALRRIEARTTL